MLYDDIDNNINGCGGKGSIIKPPLAAFFVSDCNLHDLSYGLGGTELDRIKADTGFLRAMLKDCDLLSGIKKQYYVAWAHLYFIAVRMFGWRYFNYTYDNNSTGSKTDYGDITKTIHESI